MKVNFFKSKCLLSIGKKILTCRLPFGDTQVLPYCPLPLTCFSAETIPNLFFECSIILCAKLFVLFTILKLER